MRVFRCQLAQTNKYFSERAPNYDLLSMSDAALAESQKDVLDAINTTEKGYKEACQVQEQSKKISSIYLLGIDDEATKLTKKVHKKLLLLEKGDLEEDDYDSDDS